MTLCGELCNTRCRHHCLLFGYQWISGSLSIDVLLSQKQCLICSDLFQVVNMSTHEVVLFPGAEGKAGISCSSHHNKCRFHSLVGLLRSPTPLYHVLATSCKDWHSALMPSSGVWISKKEGLSRVLPAKLAHPPLLPVASSALSPLARSALQSVASGQGLTPTSSFFSLITITMLGMGGFQQSF